MLEPLESHSGAWADGPSCQEDLKEGRWVSAKGGSSLQKEAQGAGWRGY